jgi:hypothetical protein
MNEAPPPNLCEMQVLRYALIGADVVATGNTTHTINGRPTEAMTALAICDGGGTPQSYYLFSCDENWNVITDTHHLSLDEALSQAAFEYQNILPSWRNPKNDQ